MASNDEPRTSLDAIKVLLGLPSLSIVIGIATNGTISAFPGQDRATVTERL